MILGEFNYKGELIFEVGLIGTDGEVIPVKALLDTGFTGWLAINNQDAESLGWFLTREKEKMETARGEAQFSLYEGKVVLDEEEYIIPILGGDELEEVLLGVNWLQLKRLVADFPARVLTLG